MNNNFRLINLTTALVLALVFGALLPSAAFADGETPPAPDATEVSGEGTTTEATPTETSPTEAAPTEEATPTVEPTEAAPLDQELVTTETGETEPSLTEGDTEPVADLLAELPEGTELVVLDAEGVPVPLVSEEAAEIIAGGDPIWCPSGVAPKPLINGCSDSYTNIYDLVNSGFVPTGSGTIWVQYGAVFGFFSVDGSSGTWAAAKNYSLTIQGGWNGTYGSMALNTSNPYSTFTSNLRVDNWVGSITLKNLIFQSVTVDVSTIFNAVHIVTKGNIRLDKVQVNDTINNNVDFNGHGAMLDNRSGTGTVTVTNSSFNNNEGNGLHIYSNNTITLKNVFAYSNVFYGVFARNHTAASAKAVYVSNSTFTDNGQDGLQVYSKGAITLTNITANSNGSDGAELRNYYGSTAAPIYVNGVNTFNSNTGAGLYAFSNGLIKVSKTTANSNGIGVQLINQVSPFSVGVTISGYLNALFNTVAGLNITSTGTVTAANLTTSFNAAEGTYINNTYWGTPKNVTITGYNIFNSNAYEGLEIQSRGAVTLYSLSAYSNGSDDESAGVLIENNKVSSIQSPVAINGYNYFYDNFAQGLRINSFGVVSLSNITAVHNGHGIPSAIGLGVYVNNKGGTYPKAVNIKGVNVFEENSSWGLNVLSDGAITVSKITANHNYTGAWLDNAGPVQANVIISGYGVFEGNSQKGLEVDSHGAITLSNITATVNFFNGADLNTIGLTSTHAVILYGVNNFSLTLYGVGLIINADGAITVNNITASYNRLGGAILDNYTNWDTSDFAGFGSVKVNGYGNFIGTYYGDGLNILTHGSITLNRVVADFNDYDGYGIKLVADGNITIVCSSAYGNAADGLEATTPGTLTLKGFMAYMNIGVDEDLTYGTLVRSTCP